MNDQSIATQARSLARTAHRGALRKTTRPTVAAVVDGRDGAASLSGDPRVREDRSRAGVVEVAILCTTRVDARRDDRQRGLTQRQRQIRAAGEDTGVGLQQIRLEKGPGRRCQRVWAVGAHMGAPYDSRAPGLERRQQSGGLWIVE